MNDFTASNDYVVSVIHENRVVLHNQDGENTLSTDYAPVNDHLDGHDMQALREFFQAEADERLARWRSPDDPTICVYLDEGDALVVSETEPGRGPNRIARRQLRGTDRMLGWGEAAARAYFDAPPDPKPWHEAKLGDVWVMGPLDVAYTVVGGVDSGSWFTRADVFGKVEKRDLTDDVFTTGTLVWRGMNR